MNFAKKLTILYLTNMNNQLISQFISFKQQLNKDIISILFLIFIWIFMVILVNPLGNFPLNDDWAYGRSVQTLLTKGDFQLDDWTATNLFSQVLWGALFSLPFGFSFTALRFSTLILGLIGVLATYGLFREINTNYRIALLGGLLVAINPLYFQLSNTFMNDVPFFAFAVVSLYLLLRGLKYDDNQFIIIGCVMAILAILSRQSGLAIPIAFSIAYIWQKGISKNTIVTSLFPTVLGIIVQISYQKWLTVTMRTPYAYGDQIKTLVEEVGLGWQNVLLNFTKISLFSSIYLGLFLFPLLIFFFANKFKEFSPRQRKLDLIVISILLIIGMKELSARNLHLPLVGNLLSDFGLGPSGLIDNFLPKAPTIILNLATAIGLFGGIILIHYLCFAIQEILNIFFDYAQRKTTGSIILILAFSVIYFVPISLVGLTWRGFYDRYLIVLLPTLLIITTFFTKRSINDWQKKLIPVVLIMMLIGYGFTIIATHDYLASQRVAWQASHYLLIEKQVPPEKIYGGFEFNGWYLCNHKNRTSADKYENFTCLWGDENEDYIIAYRQKKGYQIIKQYSFGPWMPRATGDVLVLQRIDNQL